MELQAGIPGGGFTRWDETGGGHRGRPSSNGLIAAARASPSRENAHQAGDRTHDHYGVLVHVCGCSIIAVICAHHEVSKTKVARASCRAVRMGPTTMGAPHRGQYHSGAVEGASAGGGVRRSKRLARAS